MSLLGKLTGWISKDRDELLSFRLDASQVQGAYNDTPIRAGRHYFRVTLVRMFLKKKVNFGKSWFPAAHSLVECAFGNSTVEIPNIADTSKLFEQQAGTGDVVAKNFHLTPLLPFNGGSVKLVAGLFAMKGEDYLNNVITVMSDFAGLLAVPQLSSVLNVAGPLASGIETLFGAGDGRMHLGYHDAFVGQDSDGAGNDGTVNYLKEGYIVVVRAPANVLDANTLWVVDQMLHKGDRLDQTTPFTDYDYMLLHVEVREERDDWDQLTHIKEPFTEALQALAEFDDEKAKTQIRLAMVAAMKSADLTKADRIRVVDRLKADYKKAQESLAFEGLMDASVGSLQQSMRQAISVDDAMAAGLPTYDQLFADI